MDEKLKKIAGALAKGAGSAVTAVGQFARECQEQADWMAAQRAEVIRKYQMEQFRSNLSKDYDRFADALGRCLRRNYAQCGLFAPECHEDLECEEEQDNIDGDNSNIIFRHEVEREPLEANVHTISQGRVKCVPAEKIEERLKAELPKYTRQKGYGYRDLSVTDIGKNKIRIEVEGVYRRSPGGWM